MFIYNYISTNVRLFLFSTSLRTARICVIWHIYEHVVYVHICAKIVHICTVYICTFFWSVHICTQILRRYVKKRNRRLHIYVHFCTYTNRALQSAPLRTQIPLLMNIAIPSPPSRKFLRVEFRLDGITLVPNVNFERWTLFLDFYVIEGFSCGKIFFSPAGPKILDFLMDIEGFSCRKTWTRLWTLNVQIDIIISPNWNSNHQKYFTRHVSDKFEAHGPNR